MLIAIKYAEYAETLRSPLRAGAFLHKHYAEGMHILVSRWAARVTPHQLAILMFVFDRTFYHAKISETIVFDQFLHGMSRTDRDEMVFSGINISLPTLLKSLKELAHENFLHVRSCESVDGKSEIRPRLYALNTQKLFNLDIADSENPMILREPKQKRDANVCKNEVEDAPIRAVTTLREPRQTRPTPSNKPPQKVEGIYNYHTDTKVSIIGTASQADTTSKIDVNSILTQRRAELAERNASRSATRPARKSNRPTDPLSMASIQSVIDGAMQMYHPTLPRVIVTAKALGVMKKRILAAQVEADELIVWTIQYWQTTANTHERAGRRRISEGGRYEHKSMPAAPDFNALAYRLPYFLACFRSNIHMEANGLTNNREAQLEQKIAKLERIVVSSRQEAHSANVRARSARRPAQAEPVEEAAPRTTRVIRTVRATPVDLNLDDDIPTWDDLPLTTRSRK